MPPRHERGTLASVTPQDRKAGKLPHSNLAARAGRWSAQHRKTAIFGWLAFVVIALVLGSATGMKQDSGDYGPGESGRAGDALERAFPTDEAEEQVLVQKKSGDITDAQFRASVHEVVVELGETEHVRDVTSPLDRGNAGQLAP